MFKFPLTKTSQQRKTARHCKTPMESNIVSIGSYDWLFLLDFPQTEIAWCSSMLFRSATAQQFLVSFTGKNVSRLGLLHMVNRGCCENTLVLCKTCLHAVYYRPMAYRAHVSSWWPATSFCVARKA